MSHAPWSRACGRAPPSSIGGGIGSNSLVRNTFQRRPGIRSGEMRPYRLLHANPLALPATQIGKHGAGHEFRAPLRVETTVLRRAAAPPSRVCPARQRGEGTPPLTTRVSRNANEIHHWRARRRASNQDRGSRAASHMSRSRPPRGTSQSGDGRGRPHDGTRQLDAPPGQRTPMVPGRKSRRSDAGRDAFASQCSVPGMFGRAAPP